MKDSPLGGIGHGAYTRMVCSSGNGVFGADATYVAGTGPSARIYIYAPCGSGTEAIEVHATAPISFHLVWTPSTGSPNGPPIVAGGPGLGARLEQLAALRDEPDLGSRRLRALDRRARPLRRALGRRREHLRPDAERRGGVRGDELTGSRRPSGQLADGTHR